MRTLRPKLIYLIILKETFAVKDYNIHNNFRWLNTRMVDIFYRSFLQFFFKNEIEIYEAKIYQKSYSTALRNLTVSAIGSVFVLKT